MTWTTPRTWVSGEAVTVPHLNTHIRDNFLSIGRWQPYTVTWTASTTNPVIGNGKLQGRWVHAGKLVAAEIEMVAGSSTTFGSGVWWFSLPDGAVTSQRAIAGWFYGENLATGAYSFWPRLSTGSSTKAELVYDHATIDGALLSAAGPTTPFTWGTGDYLAGYVLYEAS